MSAIDKLTAGERDVLMQIDLETLINRTVRVLDMEDKHKLAMQWDVLKPALLSIVQHAREDIFESRKRIARFTAGRK